MDDQSTGALTWRGGLVQYPVTGYCYNHLEGQTFQQCEGPYTWEEIRFGYAR